MLPNRLELLPLPLCLYISSVAKILYKSVYLADQSPIRPTLGLSEGRDQLAGRGSAAPPPRLRPPAVVLLLSSDIEW